MKSAMMAFTISLCLVITVVIILTINGFASRKNEMEESLASAMDEALDTVKLNKGYTVEDYKDLISDFLQELIMQVNSEGTLSVKILEMDLEKGLLDVEVSQTYTWYGREKTTSVRKTIILDEADETVPESLPVPPASGKMVVSENKKKNNATTVSFIADGEEYCVIDHCEIGKSLTTVPVKPEIEGFIFEGWYEEGDETQTIVIPPEYENDYIVEGAVTLIASYVEE